MKKLFYLFPLLVFCSCIDDSYTVEGVTDVPNRFANVDWVKSFGGSGDDTPRSIINTRDGGFAVLGFTNSTDEDLAHKNLSVNDYWLLKFSAGGQLEWHKTYGGSGDDRGQAVIETADGYAITGYAQSSDGDATNNEGFHDNWILKLNVSGSIIWERSFGYAGHDHSYDIVQARDGGFFFTGFLDVTSSNGEGETEKGGALSAHGVGEFWGTRIDENGNLDWRKYFGGTNNDRAHGVVPAHDQGYVMAGFTESDDFDISEAKGSYDFWVVKVDEWGGMEWEASFGGTGIDQGQDIAQSNDRGYLIVGRTFSNDLQVSENQGQADVWVVKIDHNGKLIWERTFGGSGFDAAHSVKPTRDGGFLIVGNSQSADGDTSQNFGENDFWLFKINTEGQLVWEQSFGGTGLDFAYDVVETLEGKILLVGETASDDFSGVESKGGQDLVVMQLSRN